MSETDEKRAEPTTGPHLKSCPFCGGDAVHTLNFKDPSKWHRFECERRFDGCPVNARTHHHEDIAGAAEAWNTRDTAAERDRLRQTVIDGEKRCIELLQERDRLLVGNAELVKSVKALLLLVGTTKNPANNFEIRAAAFHRETGKLAPGKDQPIAGPDIGATSEEYEAWGQEKIDAALAAIQAHGPAEESSP